MMRWHNTSQVIDVATSGRQPPTRGRVLGVRYSILELQNRSPKGTGHEGTEVRFVSSLSQDSHALTLRRAARPFS
jgi:hypothetical protein